MSLLCRALWRCLLALVFSLEAQASYLKLSAQFGPGAFSAKRNENSGSEGPLSFGFGVDYDINSRCSLGAEHFRSFNLKPLGTSISMTGFTTRYYVFSPVPNPLSYDAPILKARVLQDGWFPYLGWSIGFAQASVDAETDAKNVIALNLALAAKIGVDLTLYKNFGLRTELNLGSPLIGSGKISYYTLMLGGIYFW